MQAALAQSVARILGKDEVGGSNPLGSFVKKGFSEQWALEGLFINWINGERRIKKYCNPTAKGIC